MSIIRKWTKICKPAFWLNTVGVLENSNSTRFYFEESTQKGPVGFFSMDVQYLVKIITALSTISNDEPIIELDISGYDSSGRSAALEAVEFIPYHWKKRIVFRFKEPYRNWSFALDSQKHKEVFASLLSMVERKWCPPKTTVCRTDKS